MRFEEFIEGLIDDGGAKGWGASEASAVRELNRIFTLPPGRVPPRIRAGYLSERRMRRAYASYYLPANLCRFRAVITQIEGDGGGPEDARAGAAGGVPSRGTGATGEVPPRAAGGVSGHLRAARVIRVLDLGTGPGTGAIGVIQWVSEWDPPPRVECHLVDRVRPALAEARARVDRVAARCGVETSSTVSQGTVTGPIPGVPRGSTFDLVLALNVIGEIWPRRRGREVTAGHVLRWSGLLSPGGRLILMEPALRRAGRDLLGLRAEFIAADRSLRIVGPCTHHGACPLLRAPGRPWCHFKVQWKPPKPLWELARASGLRVEDLSYGYLAWGRPEAGEHGHRSGDRARVIGDRMHMSSARDGIYICHARGRTCLTAPPAASLPRRGDLLIRRGPWPARKHLSTRKVDFVRVGVE